ncbi:MAG: GNAT family N-acetyltransferase [Alphaproteobacteria bacterium]
MTKPPLASRSSPLSPHRARLVRSISGIAAEDWDACANPQGLPFDPFLSHAFLKALEDSGSVAAETGWAPHHLVLEDAQGGVLGVAPMYLKGHSQGEYVFDYGWADAYERAGGRYYPKLQIAVPFTPAAGRRLLARGGPDPDRERLLGAAAAQIAAQSSISSVHVTFATEAEWRALGDAGYLQRTDRQFHWRNEGYDSFDEFLAGLSSRKRKTIRRERAGALENGIEIEWITGSGLTEAHWDAFFEFYMDTGARKWGRPYLNREFFSLVSEAMAENILLVMCRREGRYIAGALNFIGGDTLYGRYWGCTEDHRFLHFETCYYQAMDFAIARGLKRVEAGAQGAHKVARGYAPCPTWSAHWIADPGFRDAVADYLERERQAVAEDSAELAAHLPFRRGDAQDPH